MTYIGGGGGGEALRAVARVDRAGLSRLVAAQRALVPAGPTSGSGRSGGGQSATPPAGGPCGGRAGGGRGGAPAAPAGFFPTPQFGAALLLRLALSEPRSLGLGPQGLPLVKPPWTHHGLQHERGGDCVAGGKRGHARLDQEPPCAEGRDDSENRSGR